MVRVEAVAAAIELQLPAWGWRRAAAVAGAVVIAAVVAAAHVRYVEGHGRHRQRRRSLKALRAAWLP